MLLTLELYSTLSSLRIQCCAISFSVSDFIRLSIPYLEREIKGYVFFPRLLWYLSPTNNLSTQQPRSTISSFVICAHNLDPDKGDEAVDNTTLHHPSPQRHLSGNAWARPTRYCSAAI